MVSELGLKGSKPVSKPGSKEDVDRTEELEKDATKAVEDEGKVVDDVVLEFFGIISVINMKTLYDIGEIYLSWVHLRLEVMVVVVYVPVLP